MNVLPLFQANENGSTTIRNSWGALTNARSWLVGSWGNVDSAPDDERDYRKVIEIAAQASTVATRLVAAAEDEVDLLLSMCISTPLAKLQTELPIVYCSDATATLINATYPEFHGRSAGYKRACDEIETSAFQRISAGVFASKRTLDSAVNDHRLPSERAHLLPLGANVVPSATEEIIPDVPSRERLELIIVAADPIRKRVDFCVEVLSILRKRGWNASLHSVGGKTELAMRTEHVNVHGPLALGNALDNQRQRQLLCRSHFMLLPSVGEMFGIAPCEAAHYGRPSIVSDVGGLATAIKHGQTGICMPISATPEQYADEIARIAEDESAYRKMSSAALQRAKTTLNWKAFAKGLEEICLSVLQG